ncbi:hypothetical protein EVAR_60225_1 [Eumeta japonica]|uniref:Uncharacterized protein n=1 Tax=Eumeta variegata TaxID=151549 RepID=A0A4C1Z623_EUMVA|nr:hypothetical protein EVAR_60225_1 [Eumeta japonica]
MRFLHRVLLRRVRTDAHKFHSIAQNRTCIYRIECKELKLHEVAKTEAGAALDGFLSVDRDSLARSLAQPRKGTPRATNRQPYFTAERIRMIPFRIETLELHEMLIVFKKESHKNWS